MEDSLPLLQDIVDDLKNTAPWQLERISAYIKSLKMPPETPSADELAGARQA